MDVGASPPGSEGTRGMPSSEATGSEQLSKIVQNAESAEGDALVDAYGALPHGFAAEHGYGIERLASGYAVILRSVDQICFNRVFGLGLIEPITEGLIDDLIRRYRSDGVPRSRLPPPQLHRGAVAGYSQLRRDMSYLHASSSFYLHFGKRHHVIPYKHRARDRRPWHRR